MKRLKELSFCVLIFVTISYSADFKTIAYLDPSVILKNFPNDSLYDPGSYYGQLDSFGITFVLSSADSISTNNINGIKII